MLASGGRAFVLGHASSFRAGMRRRARGTGCRAESLSGRFWRAATMPRRGRLALSACLIVRGADFRGRHLIPKLTTLGFGEFEAFCEARRALPLFRVCQSLRTERPRFRAMHYGISMEPQAAIRRRDMLSLRNTLLHGRYEISSLATTVRR